MTVPLTVLIGRSLKAAMSAGDGFRLTVDSKRPVFWELPHRGEDVRDRQGVDDVVRGNPVGVERLLVEVGLYLTDFTAIRQRNRGAGDRGQLRTDEAGRLVEQDRLGELLA